jgi:protein TonB
MFEQSLVSRARTHRTWAIAAALTAQALLVGVLIVVPMFIVPAFPLPEAVVPVTLMAPPLPPPPPAPEKLTQQTQRIVVRKFDPNRLVAPRTIPKQIATINEPPPPELNGIVGGIPGGVAGGQPGGVIGGILNSLPHPAPPPPPAKIQPAAAPKPALPRRIHVGGNVEAARLEHEVAPIYPRLAKDARIGGVVRLKAVIDPSGNIERLVVVSGHPILAQAAIDAVKQWVYKPTYLNGNPVEVDTEIDVRFTLG